MLPSPGRKAGVFCCEPRKFLRDSPDRRRGARMEVRFHLFLAGPRRILENHHGTKPVTAKLRLRLELIAALPEPIMLDRLRRLSVAELTAFRRLYGIRECRCKGRCKVQQFMLRATSAVKLGRSRRLAARLIRELRNNPTSMYQSRCQCAACRQVVPPIPFTAHQLLAQRLVPDGETAPRPPRTRPNRKRKRLVAA